MLFRMFGGDQGTDGYEYSYPLSDYLSVGVQGRAAGARAPTEVMVEATPRQKYAKLS